MGIVSVQAYARRFLFLFENKVLSVLGELIEFMF